MIFTVCTFAFDFFVELLYIDGSPMVTYLLLTSLLLLRNEMVEALLQGQL